MTYPFYPYVNSGNPQLMPNVQPQMAQMPQQIQQQQSNNSFVGVASEQDARIYPVAPGTSVTFRNETDPTLFYAKTMGNSPLDTPIFEKYRLVKEDSVSNAPQATEKPSKDKDIDLSVYALKSDVDTVLGLIEGVQNDIAKLKEKYRKRILKEVEDDE